MAPSHPAREPLLVSSSRRLPLTLVLILFALVSTFPTSTADEDSDYILPPNSIRKTVAVGQLFEFDNSLRHFQPSKWLHAYKNANDMLVGIPELKDVGRHYFLSGGDEEGVLQVDVVEEQKNACGDGKTSWIEIVDEQRWGKTTIAEKREVLNSLWELISIVKELENSKSDLRLFQSSYLARYRTIEETKIELDAGTKPAADQLIISLNISCGEIGDYASDVMDAVAENRVFRVIDGELEKNRVAVRTTTALPPSTRRTTRQIIDNPPRMLNPLSTFTCKRGILCRLNIGENTFIDVEEGGTAQLSLSVHSIPKADDENTKASRFLVAVPRSTQLEGVPMATGTFSFRLEARDRANQAASVPFQVNVQESSEPNHQFLMILDTPLEKFISKPDNLRGFVYRLSGTLKGIRDDWGFDPTSVRVNELLSNGPNQLMIKWSNTILSRRVCQEKLINDTKLHMVGTRDRVKNDFKKAMGSQFHVRKVTLELLNSCLQPQTPAPTFRVRATTVETVVDSEPASSMPSHLVILIILLTVLLLFIVLMIMFCCIQRQKRKQIKKNGDYVSKGVPVVLSDEVPHEEKDNAATITTPMLAGREQPPLDPMRMTMHENPLYKAPPMTTATLKQLVSPQVSTFSPSPRGSLVGPAIGQRQPPPYIGN